MVRDDVLLSIVGLTYLVSIYTAAGVTLILPLETIIGLARWLHCELTWYVVY
jgi:hypothetical protein